MYKPTEEEKKLIIANNQSIVENLEPNEVFRHFAAISQIPRIPKREKEISDFIAAYASGLGFLVKQDSLYNLIVYKPASTGFSHVPPVILQAHMDIYLSRVEGDPFHFEESLIQFDISGDMLKAKNSMLGADNGIGVSYMLALMEADNIVHPPLELVFTTRKEHDMEGALSFDIGLLTGHQFINLDSDDSGIHAGNECTIFSDAFHKATRSVDIMSFGPSITGSRTPSERVSISSVKSAWTQLKETLHMLCEFATAPPVHKPDKIIHKPHERLLSVSAHVSHEVNDPLYKYKLNHTGKDADTAYRIVKDQLLVEGNARLNLATFCQTYMEPQAVRLISETLDKNAIDKSLYTQTAEIEDRCIEIIADLWHHPLLPDEPEAYPDENEAGNDIPKPKGTSCIGSSEACMLGGMAMKVRWQNWAKTRSDIDLTKKPQLIISSGYQVCWEKFEKYWDVDLVQIPMDEDHLSMNTNALEAAINPYTIGVVAILGITYTGLYDNVQDIDRVVSAYNKKGLNEVNIHVDAASGGFYEPFIDENYAWDFRVDNVVSINASGHKYGLVYPGVGWIIWRNGKYLPQRLTFEVSYLGGSVRTVGINFSKSAGHIIAQYYNFIRLGHNGYKRIHEKTKHVAERIAAELAALTVQRGIQAVPVFEMLGEKGKQNANEPVHMLPLVCWKLSGDLKTSGVSWSLNDLSDRLLMRGWQVPAYPLPKNMEDVLIQRIVCRADLSADLADILIHDIKTAVSVLDTRKSTAFLQEQPLKPYGFTH